MEELEFFRNMVEELLNLKAYITVFVSYYLQTGEKIYCCIAVNGVVSGGA